MGADAMTVSVRSGLVVAIPLPSSGFAAALVVQSHKRSPICLLHCFGPRRESPESIDIPQVVIPGHQVLVMFSSNLSIASERWRVVGRLATYADEIWAYPLFPDRQTAEGKYRGVVLDRGVNPIKYEVLDEPVSSVYVLGVCGITAIEAHLDKLLADKK